MTIPIPLQYAPSLDSWLQANVFALNKEFFLVVCATPGITELELFVLVLESLLIISVCAQEI